MHVLLMIPTSLFPSLSTMLLEELMYIYPDMEHVLFGTFVRGAMVRAEHTTVADVGELNMQQKF